MTISVTFPDGSIRDVPSALRPVHDPLGATPFRHVPLDCDARWRFVEGATGWEAHPRHGSLSIFSSTPAEWWRSVAVMVDAPVEQGRRQPSRAA
ncbi:hypothetical protein [Sphingobium amiense]|uniref:hypothetical protein n=1 Tax=Sphingobium amiense TaxID=135719 RepID=UPI00082E531A|nr:hypothetical protein [Sphingobium amiense]